MLKETNTPTRPRIEPGSPDPESDALTIRPVRPPILVYERIHKLVSLKCESDKYFGFVLFDRRFSQLEFTDGTCQRIFGFAYWVRNQRTNGPVNAHLMSCPSKAQNIKKIAKNDALQSQP